MHNPWTIAGKTFSSRVFLGSALYPNLQSLLDCVDQAQIEVVTVSLRRMGAVEGSGDLIQSLLSKGCTLLPNTAGCFTAKDAVKTAQLAREALGEDWVKLEVISDEESLLPDAVELLEAARILVGDGFRVLPYTNDDPVLAKRLEQLGCAAVMPLASPIGSGQGIENPHNLKRIVASSGVPVIVDAGLGTASDVAQAFELGADGVLLNTAVARAEDPVLMAKAIAAAAQAGYAAYRAGRIPKQYKGAASSPIEGVLRDLE